MEHIPPSDLTSVHGNTNIMHKPGLVARLNNSQMVMRKASHCNHLSHSAGGQGSTAKVNLLEMVADADPVSCHSWAATTL